MPPLDECGAGAIVQRRLVTTELNDMERAFVRDYCAGGTAALVPDSWTERGTRPPGGLRFKCPDRARIPS